MGFRDFFQDFLDQSDLPEELLPFVESDSAEKSENDQDTDQADIEEFAVDIGSIYSETAYVVKKDKKRLIIDPEHGNWEESKEKLKEAWAENGRLFKETAFDLFLSIQANKSNVEEVCKTFEPPVLRPIQHDMLEEAYHTGIYFSNFDISHEDEQRRRRQLGNDYGELAMNLPSLCSAGYFERNGLFHNLLRDIEPDYDTYQDIFKELVRHRPFVIFVEGTTGPSEIYDLIIQKSLHLDKLDVDVDTIHVRGVGSGARDKIISALDMLKEEHESVEHIMEKGEKTQDDETVLAIDNDSL